MLAFVTRGPGELGVALGHERGTSLLAAHDQAHVLAHFEERIQHRQITLAWNAEGGVGSVELQLIHQNPTAVAQRHVVVHRIRPCTLSAGLYRRHPALQIVHSICVSV